jgi:hypothetical protein
MPSIWDLLPASAWPVQPFVWPFNPTQPSPGTQTVSPQPSASAAPAFGWASAPPAPPNAPAYAGAPDPDGFLGAFPRAEADPAGTARLAEDARRAFEFARWAFGPPSRPAGQTRELAAGPDASASRFGPTAAADTVDAPPRGGAMSGIDDAGNRPVSPDVPVPANWADQWDAPVVNPDAAPAGVVSDPPAPPVAPLDQNAIAATPPERLSAQARYHRAQAGDESFAPQFVRTGPTYPEAVLQGLSDTGRMMTTPPLRPPPGSYEDDAGFTHQGNADPDAWEALVADQRARADLGPRTAVGIITGAAGFAERGALGVGGGRLRGPPLKGQPPPRLPDRPVEPLVRDLAQPANKFDVPLQAPNALRLTGQLHHGISKRIYNALEDHNLLKGAYEHRDARFATQAVDKDAHKGYQQWHRSLDSEIAQHIRENPEMTPEEFEEFLRTRYREPDLIARFPNGL